eukprot:1154475-Pelagomonas_calceolata.AAC.9
MEWLRMRWWLSYIQAGSWTLFYYIVNLAFTLKCVPPFFPWGSDEQLTGIFLNGKKVFASQEATCKGYSLLSQTHSFFSFYCLLTPSCVTQQTQPHTEDYNSQPHEATHQLNVNQRHV